MWGGRMNQCVAAIVGGLICSTAHAIEPFAATPQEKALCSALVFGGKDPYYWKGIEPGVGWEHTHHWCDCVRFRFRAIKSTRDKGAHGHYLNEAVGGCTYVIEAVRPVFRALPRVYVDRGRAYSLRGDRGLAVRDFLKAIELDPTEVNAYLDLAELQRSDGNRTPALETVTLGLRNNPDAKSLQKMYLELGGREPFPAPIARVESAPDKKPLPTVPSEAPLLSPVEPVEQIVVPVETDSMGDGTVAVDEPATDSVDGNPGRSCRFCPPEEIQRRWVDSFKSRQEKTSE